MVFEVPYATIRKICWKLSTTQTHKSTQIDICLRRQNLRIDWIREHFTEISISNIRRATKDDDDNGKENTEEADKTDKRKRKSWKIFIASGNRAIFGRQWEQ